MYSYPKEIISDSLCSGFKKAYPESKNQHCSLFLLHEPQNLKFGDLQCNAAMALAKELNENPRSLAEKILENCFFPSVVDSFNIAGPGFINIKLNQSILGDELSKILNSVDNDSLGVINIGQNKNIVIDLCGVNVAKQMHVGHLRSTIIGEALANINTRLGYNVFRENHLGDWGLPIAMVISYLKEQNADFKNLTISDLDKAYKSSQEESKEDSAGLKACIKNKKGPHRIAELNEQNSGAKIKIKKAKETLLLLQEEEKETTKRWKDLIDCTLDELFSCLSMLNIVLKKDHNRGESFYRKELPVVVELFVKKGIAKEDDGATVVTFSDRQRPLLIKKQDGGYLYATTDLAAIKFRIEELNASSILYVVDSRQKDHFKDVFDACELIGWNQKNQNKKITLKHVSFGSVLGADKKPLKTRSGTNLTLRSLLEESINRGISEVKKRQKKVTKNSLTNEECCRVGKAVGISAIKYADLSNDLSKDYVFDLNKMISFEGDTGPYLQYAHARMSGILRKSKCNEKDLKKSKILLKTSEEIFLTKKILEYNTVLNLASEKNTPHKIATWLKELCNTFSSFYQNCPVLDSENTTKMSRLRLCNITKKCLADGLLLLGIEPLEKM